jgi:hypothetical protein
MRWLIVILVLAAIVGIGAYWLGPGVVPRARVELLAFDVTGRFAADAQLAPPDSATAGDVRYPLVLAVQNSGLRSAELQELSLSLPGWSRLIGPTGLELQSTNEGDEPLRTYRFPLDGDEVEPGALPVVIDGMEGLSLVARLPATTCRMRWDGVPEFDAMPDYDATLIATVRAFYSVVERRERETGELTLHLDPSRVEASVANEFVTGPIEIGTPTVSLPAVGPVRLEGRRTSVCGAPELRYEIESIVWRTGADSAGRLIIVAHQGVPRRLLFDLDGNGRVELEAWDGDGDGRAEAKRAASYRIPVFLIPVPPPPPPDTMRADSTAADSTTVRADSTRADTARTRADTSRIDTTRRAATRDTLPPAG